MFVMIEVELGREFMLLKFHNITQTPAGSRCLCKERDFRTKVTTCTSKVLRTRYLLSYDLPVDIIHSYNLSVWVRFSDR